MPRSIIIAMLAGTLLAMPVSVEARPQAYPTQQALPPEALDQMRGGFDLPNGMILTMGVTTLTSVDGREALRTVLKVNGPEQTLATYADTGNGLVLVPAQQALNGVQTALGNVRVNNGAGAVQLSGAGLDVSHLIGTALGSVVANSTDSRTIDVQTTLDITVGGVRPELLGGGMSAVNNVAAEAATRLAR